MAKVEARKDHIGDPLKPRTFVLNRERDQAFHSPNVVSVRKGIDKGICFILDTSEFNEDERYLVTFTSVPNQQTLNQPGDEISLISSAEYGRIQREESNLIPNAKKGCNSCGSKSLEAKIVNGHHTEGFVPCPHCQTQNKAKGYPVTVTEDVAFIETSQDFEAPYQTWSEA